MNHQVAEARRVLEEAQSVHRAATEKVAQIDTRIAACRARQQQITAARLEGEATTADAAEFAALVGDVETLTGMLAGAQTEAVATTSACDEALRRLAYVEQQAARALAEAEFAALAQKSAELDAALCKIIGHMHAIGKGMLGHVSLTQTWRPSSDLDRALRLNVCPGGN